MPPIFLPSQSSETPVLPPPEGHLVAHPCLRLISQSTLWRFIMQSQTVASNHHKKRDRIDDASSERRKRRTRYALRACHECKRRKVRCDGHMPCEHCQSRSVECHYDTDPRLLSNCVCNVSYPINGCNEPGGDSKEDTRYVYYFLSWYLASYH